MKKQQAKAQKMQRRGPGAVKYSYNSQPFPDEMRVTLRYNDFIDATASVGAYNYAYSLNDVYDPDYTSTGSQPLGYDEWSAIYNRWVVTELEYDIGVTSRSVSNRLTVAVAPTTATTLIPTTVEAASSMRYSKVASTTGGGPTYRIRGTCKVSTIYGVPDFQVEADDAFMGASGASPNRRLILAICCQTSGSSDALSFEVTLKYKVRFFQPSVLAVSLSSRAPAAVAAASPGFTITHPGPACLVVPRKRVARDTAPCDVKPMDCEISPLAVAFPEPTPSSGLQQSRSPDAPASNMECTCGKRH